MTNAEHIIEWAKSSRPHYDRLCDLEIDRTKYSAAYGASVAVSIVASAYGEATRCGDMKPYNADDILDAAKLALRFEKES